MSMEQCINDKASDAVVNGKMGVKRATLEFNVLETIHLMKKN